MIDALDDRPLIDELGELIARHDRALGPGEGHEVNTVEIFAVNAERVAKAKDLGNTGESQGAIVEQDPEKPEIIVTVRGVGYRAGESKSA